MPCGLFLLPSPRRVDDSRATVQEGHNPHSKRHQLVVFVVVIFLFYLLAFLSFLLCPPGKVDYSLATVK